MLKLTKNQENAKQHPAAQYLLFEDYLQSFITKEKKTHTAVNEKRKLRKFEPCFI